MILKDYLTSWLAKLISMLLIITTQSLFMTSAFAESLYQQQLIEATQNVEDIYSNFPYTSVNTTGDIVLDGEVVFSAEDATGQKDNTYLATDTSNAYGSDANTIIAGETVQGIYDNKEPETDSEMAYDLLKKTFSIQRPDLSNDPIWDQTDNVFENLSEIAKDFTECRIDTQVISDGVTYHVPTYERCEKLPIQSKSVTVGHSYDAGVIKHESGPFNIASCGDGCINVWIGTIGNNYWTGSCTIYEEEVVVEIIQPNVITFAELQYSYFDDYHQVLINGELIYNGPNGEFPPEIGTTCDLSRTWAKAPEVDITSRLTSVESGDTVEFKTRTSVGGEGEGYSRFKIEYDPDSLVFNDEWTTPENVLEIIDIQNKLEEGICTGTVTCGDMPALDANGCAMINGFNVCEDDFDASPIDGISPFCRRVDADFDCAFNEGEICTTNMAGEETCFQNETVDANTCEALEQSETCSYVGTECVEGAMSDAGTCYVQTDTYDCGYDATLGTESVQEVLICDGELQCVGESCYSPQRDEPNSSFVEANAYLQVLQYAQNDFTCENVPEASYTEENTPDRYYPTVTCPTGFEYNSVSNTCLQQVGECSFDQDNYYAVSSRTGAQIVSEGVTIFENSAITYCTPIDIGGYTYTCGETLQKISNDEFSEVCQNTSATAIAASCVTDTHLLKDGICEVPPTSLCPSGYILTEGDDPWSVEDDTCTLNAEVSYECTDSVEIYNPETGICEGFVSTSPTCETGYSLVGDTCQQTSVAEASYTCPSLYVPHDTQYCERYTNGTAPTETCSIDYSIDLPRNCTTNNKYYDHEWKLRERNGTCFQYCEYDDDDGQYTYDSEPAFVEYSCGTKENINGTCYDTTVIDADVTCPTGYTEIDSQCYNTSTSSPVCEDGQSLNSATGLCEASYASQPIITCSNSSLTYNAETETCEAEVSAEISCVGDYPVWNEEQNRCTSASASPLAKENNRNESKILDEILAPFGSFFDSIIPKAYASDIDSNMEVNELFTDYIGEQFIAIKDEQEEYGDDMEEQISSFTSVMARSVSTTSSTVSDGVADGSTDIDETEYSEDAPVEATPSGDVTCELFKGTAQTCKIAVGGMQDCCENPVTVSLGDYIALTQKMVTMDAVTAQLGLIDGYNGAWNTATDYVVDAANYAGEAWSSAWSSTADVAQGASSAGTSAAEGATEGVVSETMAAFTQEVMSATNNFLIESFGPDVASVFFETTVTEAGVSSVGPSAAMTFAGTALLYIYYAYLAYVVFTLIVGIIYACEDEELDLAMKRDLLSTHYLGSYCAQEVLGVCIEKRESHCVFDSPMSRIMMEQVYMQPQMGLDWGTAKNPNCQGLALEDVSKVIWEDVNLDEWIGILISTGNIVDQSSINVETLTGLGSYMTNGLDRDNVIESNLIRSEDYDADEVSREAYEAMWEEYQTPIE